MRSQLEREPLYGALAACWIVLSAFVLTGATDDPVLQGRVEVLKGLVFVAGTSGLIYVLSRRHHARIASDPAPPLRFAERAAPLVLAVALIVPVLGAGVYTMQEQVDEQHTISDLVALVDLKAVRIEEWLAKRRRDADSLAGNAAFVARVRRAALGDPRELELVGERLAGLQEGGGYAAVSLFDATGGVLRHVGAPGEFADRFEDERAGLTPDEPATRTVFHRDASGRLHLDIVAALSLRADRAPDPVGTLVLHLDPEAYVSRLLEVWPTASPTGELRLVARHGDSVTYLTPSPRHPQLARRAALTEATLPAAIAVNVGRAGTTSRSDYAGAPVLSAWRPVAGTPWFLTATIDRYEARAPARSVAGWVSAVGALAVLLAAGALVALWRMQQRVDALRLRAQSDRMFRLFYDLPFVGMAIVEPQTGRLVMFNDGLASFLGRSREELAPLAWQAVCHPDDLPDAERLRAREIGGYASEGRFLLPDGRVRFAHVDVRRAREPGGDVDYFVVTVKDLTESRAANLKIADLGRMYATLSRCNEAIVRCTSEEELYHQVCRAAVEEGGLRMAWVGIPDGQGELRPAASFGDDSSYLHDLGVSVRADDPRGGGPAGSAVREGVPRWSQDFLADPCTAPWHARGANAGWRSEAALPLRRNGEVIGALTLYSTVTDRFDQETRRLLVDMAADISFALDNFQRDAQRRSAESTLRDQYEELRRWYAAMLGREARILALKREVNLLAREAEVPPPYPSAAPGPAAGTSDEGSV